MKLLIMLLILVGVSGCSTMSKHEQAVSDQALATGMVTAPKSYFDASFVAPNVPFSGYKKIIVNDLDFSQVNIIEPSSQPFSERWVLTEDDKSSYQKRFSESVAKTLIDSNFLLPARNVGEDTLILKTKIIEVAPHASKDNSKSRPGIVDVYSEGFGRMTIVFELYDSVTNKLIMISTDERELGNTWELNNRVQNNFRIRLAFDSWLRDFKKQLIAVKKL